MYHSGSGVAVAVAPAPAQAPDRTDVWETEHKYSLFRLRTNDKLNGV